MFIIKENQDVENVEVLKYVFIIKNNFNVKNVKGMIYVFITKEKMNVKNALQIQKLFVIHIGYFLLNQRIIIYVVIVFQILQRDRKQKN